MGNDKAYELAAKFVNGTDRHVFLTGKAGTGKTTFLKDIVERTHKKVLVAAPTGIAAINAGGVTLHSLFQLPFGVFIPTNLAAQHETIPVQLNTPHSIRKSLRINKQKQKMIREMELLIIDEVSMLRADILDAIDHVLKMIRRSSATFGGVQVVFIGDLLQLPPVIKKQEKQYLEHHYNQGYFFEAMAIQASPPVYIELENIYRQDDPAFIRILNHLRNDALNETDLHLLNQCYQPGFQPSSGENYVFLTTHNAKADQINREALKKLPGTTYRYSASKDGDFGEHLYPVDQTLELKKGAQVMFIKNDYSGEQRYFNGKIGVVSDLSDEHIEVEFGDGSPSTTVEEYTWENKQYSLNKENNEIQEKVKGTFTQYPLKLAWAITVHKSQGLTFEKAIIDVSRAFAPGQIYVALSRLVSLDGLVLNAPIPTHMLKTDPALERFHSARPSHDELEKEYQDEKPRFLINYLLRAFDLSGLDSELKQHLQSYNKKAGQSTKQQYQPWAEKLVQQFAGTRDVADRFQKQLKGIGHSADPNWLSNLQTRVKKAEQYFETHLADLSGQIEKQMEHLDSEANVKKYIRELGDLEHVVYSRRQAIEKAHAMTETMISNKQLNRENISPSDNGRQHSMKAAPANSKKNKAAGRKTKEKKTGTKEFTYNLFRKGKSVEEIAAERQLAVSTIEGHLSHWVAAGAIDVLNFLSLEKLEQIISVAQKIESTKLSEIKARLGDEFTYSDLRFAMAKYHFDHNEH